MARVTAYPATSIARLLLDFNCQSTGIVAPEVIGKKTECSNRLFEDLEKKGVVFNVSKKVL
jgi:hypothetical protein